MAVWKNSMTTVTTHNIVYISRPWWYYCISYILLSLCDFIWKQNQNTYGHSALTLLVGWHKGDPACKKLGVGLFMHILQLQLSPPSPSSLSPIKSRMKTFWFRLTQVVLEKGPLNECCRVDEVTCNTTCHMALMALAWHWANTAPIKMHK